MTIELKYLNIGTEFLYEGVRYQKTSNEVSSGMVLSHERLYTDDEIGLLSYSCKCAPFLGGQFQPKIAKYILSYKKVYIE